MTLTIYRACVQQWVRHGGGHWPAFVRNLAPGPYQHRQNPYSQELIGETCVQECTPNHKISVELVLSWPSWNRLGGFLAPFLRFLGHPFGMCSEVLGNRKNKKNIEFRVFGGCRAMLALSGFSRALLNPFSDIFSHPRILLASLSLS